MRRIVHLDIAAFAVAVERVRAPGLGRRPVLIAPSAPRGRVLSLSEEARAAGVRRGMEVDVAARICREVIILPPDEPLYARAADAVREILRRFSPVIEPVGYGRAFLDVTGTDRLLGPASDVALRVQREVRESLRLSASAGVAVNKLVSRVAADESAPCGLLEVPPGDEASFLAPLSVRRLPGVGRNIWRDLEDLNIRLVRQLAEISAGHLVLAFGHLGVLLHDRALGIDPTPVRPPEQKPAIVEEARIPGDTAGAAPLRAALGEALERACLRLRRSGERAGRMEIALRYADDRTAAGRRRLLRASGLHRDLMREGVALLDKVRARRVRVRSMVVRLTALERGPRQPFLFEEDEREARRGEALASALDALRTRGIAVSAGRGWNGPGA